MVENTYIDVLHNQDAQFDLLESTAICRLERQNLSMFVSLIRQETAY